MERSSDHIGMPEQGSQLVDHQRLDLAGGKRRQLALAVAGLDPLRAGVVVSSMYKFPEGLDKLRVQRFHTENDVEILLPRHGLA